MHETMQGMYDALLQGVTAWFQADNQGRTYDDATVWGCSLQGCVCNAAFATGSMSALAFIHQLTSECGRPIYSTPRFG